MVGSGVLLLVMIDHLSGEDLGHLLTRLAEWGAPHAHALPTLTKKGRPGTVLLVDAGGADEEALAFGLAREFGVSGFHRLETAHVHQPVAVIRREVAVEVEARIVRFALDLKVVGDPAAPASVRAEADGLLGLRRLLQEHTGGEPSIPALRRWVEGRFAAGEELAGQWDPASGGVRAKGSPTG